MRQRSLALIVAALLLAVATRAEAPNAESASTGEEPRLVPATLEGLAVLEALTLVEPPGDAPDSCRGAGKYTAADGRRRDAPGPAGEANAPGANGVALPFLGRQPVQGFSALEPLGDGTLLALSDNGFGTRRNSPDVLLVLHRVEPRFETGELVVRETIHLRDPDRVIPFPVANEATRERYLTGADLDPESLRKVGDELWIGDEFGPYLVRADLRGRVAGLFEGRFQGRALRSPDHFTVQTPASPGRVEFEVRRSRGFEGLGASPDGRFLYPMLEAPLVGESEALILEFDRAAHSFSDRSWRLPLAEDRALAELFMLDAARGLVLERDEREGGAARVKRVCAIALEPAGTARRTACIDLLDVADPRGRAGARGAAGRYRMPFLTIEGVARVDDERILVVNDNNLPFSAGRTKGHPDATEVALVRAPELVKAR